MIVADSSVRPPPLSSTQPGSSERALMERKLSDRSWPPLPPAAPDALAIPPPSLLPTPPPPPPGAVAKSRSLGKLESIRTSLKLGRKKSVDENDSAAAAARKEDKKAKKKAKKEAAVREVSASNESLPPKKVSKATQLVRKLSIGRYRSKGEAKGAGPEGGGGGGGVMSPTLTSPEMSPAASPAASRTDVSEEEVRSVGSSASEGRQGPEGDEGALQLRAPSPATPPPPRADDTAAASAAAPPGQSPLIGGACKGPTGQWQGGGAAPVPTPRRQSLDGGAARKDRDPALATVPEAAEAKEPRQRSPPQSQAQHEDEQTPGAAASASRPAAASAAAVSMSQRRSRSPAPAPAPVAAPPAPSAPSDAAPASTKSQILSITTPAVKKQQAYEAAAGAAASNSSAASGNEPKASASHAASKQPHKDKAKQAKTPTTPPAPAPTPTPTPAPAPKNEPAEDSEEQFGDVEEASATVNAPSRKALSAPPPPATASASAAAPAPSAASVMAEARARLSQSLGGSDVVAQPVNEKREHLYKILVIGELGTGKTSIIKRYVHQFFSQHYRATIGVDFALKVLNWDANTVIRLQLWDIAGQERFGNMTRVYYKEAVGAFIVFDVTRAATFDAVVKWKQDLDAKVTLSDGSPIPCVLLANKCDQQKEGMVNSATKMEEYCRDKGFAAWFETSAKENINIEDAARCLVTKILQNDKLIHNENGRDHDKFALGGKMQGEEKAGKSCAC